ncbi:hypothetical protein ScPMuIL_014888 [Solemya velum]
MDLAEAVVEFQQLLPRIRPDCVDQFISWIKEQSGSEQEKSTQEKILDSIRDDIRQSIPFNALGPTEKIHFATNGPNSDCNPRNTVHVDAFLYDDDAIDSLCEEGKLSRNHCMQCGSQDVRPLNFITHSASITEIKFIFQYLLPELGGKVVLDVGSRTGAILYGAYLFTNASQIVGVEMDEFFCQLQQKVVEKYAFGDRIKIVHNDVQNEEQLLQCSDVIILNNVFEFFVPTDVQERLWCFLSEKIRRSGTLLITIPSIEESLQHLTTSIDVTTWIKPVDISEKLKHASIRLGNSDEMSELDGIFMYQVL